MNEQERYDEVCKPNFDSIHEKLDKIFDCLTGNGKTGLVTRIEMHQQDIDHFKAYISWAIGLLTATGLAIVGLVGERIWAHIF